jgi:hypothetical protein
MLLPRLTIRRMMATVTIVALICEAERLSRWRAHFLELAEAHASRKYDYGEGRGFICPKDEWYVDGRIRPEWWTLCDQTRDRSAALEMKYRRAALFPFLPVPPDPPWPASPSFSREK